MEGEHEKEGPEVGQWEEKSSSVSLPIKIAFWGRYRCWALCRQVMRSRVLATPGGGAAFFLWLMSPLGSAPQPL